MARAALLAGLVVAVIPASATAQPAVTARVSPAVDARAQELAHRIAGAGDGSVRFSYAVRPSVCGDGAYGISVADASGARHSVVHGADGGWAADACVPGPARVTIAVRGGVPGAVRLTIGGRWRDDDRAGAVEIGSVPAAVAAAYLLEVAARPDGPSPDRAILAAVVADSSVVWPPLLRLARDERLPRSTRRDATFWAGHFACDAITAARAGPAPADTADRDVRTQVVFALSQHPDEERAAALTRVARSDHDPAVRCAALFWLGQDGHASGADAERTLRLFEDVLRRP